VVVTCHVSLNCQYLRLPFSHTQSADSRILLISHRDSIGFTVPETVSYAIRHRVTAQPVLPSRASSSSPTIKRGADPRILSEGGHSE